MQASVPVASGPELAAADIAHEPFLEDPVERAARDQRAARRMAIAMGLAILLHLLVVAVTVIAPDWWRRAEPPKAIPITLVAEPTLPPPPPAEKPAPPPPPAPPAHPYAESGPDEQTTSAPTEEPPQPAPSPASSANEPAPETAPEPIPAPPKAAEPLPQRQLPKAPQRVPKPLPPSKPAPPKAPPKPKPRTMARLAPSGEKAMTGDPYLNLVAAWNTQRRRYPEYFRHNGLVGTASFLMTWARNGEIVGLELIISSGNSAIDLYAEELIRSSSPVPPMPANRTGPAMTVKVDVPVAP
jgi:TonB family protein